MVTVAALECWLKLLMSLPLCFCEVARNSLNPELEDECLCSGFVRALVDHFPHLGPQGSPRWDFLQDPSSPCVLSFLDFLEFSPTNPESQPLLRVRSGEDLSASGFEGKNRVFNSISGPVQRRPVRGYCIVGTGKAWELWFMRVITFQTEHVFSKPCTFNQYFSNLFFKNQPFCWVIP